MLQTRWEAGMAGEVTQRRTGRIGALDWLMLALALFSVGLLGYVTFWPVPESTQYTVFVVDTCICGIFAAEFLWRWRQEGWKRAFVARNWYEILGMIPVSHPALRGFRLLRVIRIVVVLIRLRSAADRAFGQRVVQKVIARFSGPIVEAVKRPITVAVLEEVISVLQTGHYTHNIAHALRENQHEIRAMVLEKLREDPQTGRLRGVPFYDEIVGSVSDTVLRVVMQVLTDERTDELVADALRENVEQIRQAVRDSRHTVDEHGRGGRKSDAEIAATDRLGPIARR